MFHHWQKERKETNVFTHVTNRHINENHFGTELRLMSIYFYLLLTFIFSSYFLRLTSILKNAFVTWLSTLICSNVWNYCFCSECFVRVNNNWSLIWHWFGRMHFYLRKKRMYILDQKFPVPSSSTKKKKIISSLLFYFFLSEPHCIKFFLLFFNLLFAFMFRCHTLKYKWIMWKTPGGKGTKACFL